MPSIALYMKVEGTSRRQQETAEAEVIGRSLQAFTERTMEY